MTKVSDFHSFKILRELFVASVLNLHLLLLFSYSNDLVENSVFKSSNKHHRRKLMHDPFIDAILVAIIGD